MVETGTVKKESLVLTREVKDILDATNKVFNPLGIVIPAVDFKDKETLQQLYEESLQEEDAVLREFKERSLPTRLLPYSNSEVGIVTKTPAGPQIYLSDGIFGPIFEQKSNPNFCANSTLLFTAVCHLTLQSAASEVEISRDRQDTNILITDVSNVLQGLAAESENSREIIAYADDLVRRLQENNNLRIVGRGHTVSLREGDLIYINEFENADIFVTSIIEQHLLRDLFMGEMKRSDWFTLPQKWPEGLRRQYRSRFLKIPNEMKDLYRSLDRYLSSYFAQEALRNLQGRQNGTITSSECGTARQGAEANLQNSSGDKLEIEAPQINQNQFPELDSANKKNGRIEPGAKKKKERKNKIYPKQRRAQIKEAKAQEEAKLIDDALAVIDSFKKMNLSDNEILWVQTGRKTTHYSNDTE